MRRLYCGSSLDAILFCSQAFFLTPVLVLAQGGRIWSNMHFERNTYLDDNMWSANGRTLYFRTLWDMHFREICISQIATSGSAKGTDEGPEFAKYASKGDADSRQGQQVVEKQDPTAWCHWDKQFTIPAYYPHPLRLAPKQDKQAEHPDRPGSMHFPRNAYCGQQLNAQH